MVFCLIVMYLFGYCWISTSNLSRGDRWEGNQGEEVEEEGRGGRMAAGEMSEGESEGNVGR